MAEKNIIISESQPHPCTKKVKFSSDALISSQASFITSSSGLLECYLLHLPLLARNFSLNSSHVPNPAIHLKLRQASNMAPVQRLQSLSIYQNHYKTNAVHNLRLRRPRNMKFKTTTLPGRVYFPKIWRRLAILLVVIQSYGYAILLKVSYSDLSSSWFALGPDTATNVAMRVNPYLLSLITQVSDPELCVACSYQPKISQVC